MQVIGLACTFVPQLNRPCLDFLSTEDSDSSCLGSLLAPLTKSLIVIKFLKQLSADNETHASGIDPVKEPFSSRSTLRAKHLVSDIRADNRTH